jgi:D-hexose-6-phosphate mutarotase
MENGFNYFRIKTEWTAERNDGGLAKTKTEELVYASSYTEAEKVAFALVEDQGRMQFNSSINLEIDKTKIDEILFNSTLCADSNLIAGLVHNYFEEGDDTGVGLYAVKIMYIELDEKSGKEKRSNDTIYTPAASNTDAANYVKQYLKKFETRDFVIRDTKFDKAEAILWSPDMHKEKTGLSEQF